MLQACLAWHTFTVNSTPCRKQQNVCHFCSSIERKYKDQDCRSSVTLPEWVRTRTCGANPLIKNFHGDGCQPLVLMAGLLSCHHFNQKIFVYNWFSIMLLADSMNKLTSAKVNFSLNKKSCSHCWCRLPLLHY